MLDYVTDNQKIQNQNPDFRFFNSLLDWRVSEHGAQHYLKKKARKIKNPVAICAPSNYRLIYDIYTLKKDADIYFAEEFDLTKPQVIDRKELKREMHKYFVRSYLSFLNYRELMSLGLKRIEQFIILSNSRLLMTKNMVGSLVFEVGDTVEKILNQEEKIKTISNITLPGFVAALTKISGHEEAEILKYIQYAYNDLDITDPFLPGGFKILKEENLDQDFVSLYKKLQEPIRYVQQTIKISGREKPVVVEAYHDEVAYYFGGIENPLFEGEILTPKCEAKNKMLLEGSARIFPMRDVVLTILTLLKMKKISFDLKADEALHKKLLRGANSSWLMQKTWNHLYQVLDWHFNHIVAPLTFQSFGFVCPECKSEEYNVTPEAIFCRNKFCNFKMKRGGLKNFFLPKLTVEESLYLLNSGSIMTENIYGKNVVVELKNTDKTYYPSYVF